MNESVEHTALAATVDINTEERVEETNITTGSPFRIKEYSETSSVDDSNDAGEEKENNSRTAASESIEEGEQDHSPRTAADEEYEKDLAQQKKNRRARAQPGAKRGGRKDTRKKSSWGGFLGRKKIQFEAGDLVEAEWWESGWWYVGYIQGEPEGQEESSGAAAVKFGAHKNDLFHVVFADGDEADVLRKNLKRLGSTDSHGKHSSSRFEQSNVQCRQAFFAPGLVLSVETCKQTMLTCFFTLQKITRRRQHPHSIRSSMK